MQQTLSIIKPDAIKKNVIGEILKRFEKNNLKIIGCKMLHLTKDQAQKFYLVHKDKPFYNALVTFMTSGPILVSVLYGKNAIEKNREIMGVTDSKKAAKGTIRKDFGTDIEVNAVHGSDSEENAKIEVSFFFNENEIFIR